MDIIPASDSEGKWSSFNNKEYFASQICVFFFFSPLDSSMELLEQSSNEDAASNIDTDADIVEFDTDLPAAHNVCTFSFLLI